MMNYRSRRNSSEIREERYIFQCGLRSMTVQLDDEWDLTIPRMAERTLGNYVLENMYSSCEMASRDCHCMHL